MEGLNSKPGTVSVFQKYMENRLSFQSLLLLPPSLIPLFSAELVVRISLIKNVFGSKFPDLNLVLALTKAIYQWTGGGHCPLALLWALDFDGLGIKGCSGVVGESHVTSTGGLCQGSGSTECTAGPEVNSSSQVGKGASSYFCLCLATSALLSGCLGSLRYIWGYCTWLRCLIHSSCGESCWLPMGHHRRNKVH